MKKYKVISNTHYDHNFEIGQIVGFVREYQDGVYEVAGYISGEWNTQHVHPIDLQRVGGELDENSSLETIVKGWANVYAGEFQAEWSVDDEQVYRFLFGESLVRLPGDSQGEGAL